MRLVDESVVLSRIHNAYQWNEVHAWLKIAPTVDAVEVVRCKDCKHSEHWYRDKRRCFLWSEDGIDVFDDGFCNYAERGQDGQT